MADPKNYYKLLAPRPVVLVTTVDERGRPDVAPFSFVSPVSFDPPLLMLAVGPNKHSYWNMTRKKEFVVNVPTEKMLEKVWIAGGKHDPNASKIEKAGLQTAPAERVAPPRLTECAASMECYLESARKEGDHVLVIGRVVALHYKPDLVDDEGRLRADIARPPLHVSENLFAFPYVTKEV